MKKPLLFISALLFALSGCTNDFGVEETRPEQDWAGRAITRSQTDSGTGIMTLGQKQINPYALVIMQQAADELEIGAKLEPTHLYVRFLPTDSTQYNILARDMELELFDFPLDYEIIQEGSFYHDPTLPEDAITWQYTTVEPGFSFPENITYEVLEECYIPNTEDEEISMASGGDGRTTAQMLEEQAFAIAGIECDEPEAPARASAKRPEGKFQFWDDCNNYYKPLKGVKVRCHVIVKWSTTFTREDGTYSMDSKFRIGPHYALVFHNSKGFELYCNWGPLARANYNMGWHNKKGYSENISRISEAWKWCAVSNAGYEYYQMCEKEGIAKPPHDLKVWVFKHKGNASAAPMLNKLGNVVGFNPSGAIVRFLNNMFINYPANFLLSFFRNWLPDVTIGCKGSDIKDIYEIVNHEFAHASHFSKVGSNYWADYVSYIITYGAYGQESYYNAGVCGVGEMWGYAMGWLQYHEQYMKDIVRGSEMDYPRDESLHWFKPHILWDLYRDRIVNKQQIFSCLTSDVRSVMSLRSKMIARYPAKTDRIKEAFFDYGYYDYKGEWSVLNDTEQPLVVFIDKTLNSDRRDTLNFPLNPGESAVIFGRADESEFTAIRYASRGLHSVTVQDEDEQIIKRWCDDLKSINDRAIFHDGINFFVYGDKWELTKTSYNNRYNYLWTFTLDEESLAD